MYSSGQEGLRSRAARIQVSMGCSASPNPPIKGAVGECLTNHFSQVRSVSVSTSSSRSTGALGSALVQSGQLLSVEPYTVAMRS